jgi:hypothetical protein
MARLTNCYNLKKINPKLAKQWHPTKNGNLTPKDCTPNSNKKVWWICDKGHDWSAKIYNRSHGSGCPYCSGNGLYAYRFDRGQIRTYLRSIIASMKGGDINVGEFARKYGCDEAAINFLAKKQFIKTYYGGNPLVGQLISRTVADRFNATYIFSSEVAKDCKVQPATVLSHLSKASIFPVSGPQVDGGRRYLYLRKDLNDFDLTQIKPSRRSLNKNL